MRLNSRLTVLHMSMLAALLVPLEAEGEDYGCEIEVKVPRGTVYKAFPGEDLRINCTVEFCSDSPPTVVWYKAEKEAVPVNVDSNSHIRTEWRHSNHREGFSYLIFQKILLSDSGVYLCQSGETVSHSINVLVSENNELECSTVEQTTITTTRGTTSERQVKKTIWPLVYRLVGVLVFVIIVITLCIRPKCGCKGVCCAGRSGDASDPSHQPSDDDSPVIHIYENDQ